MHINSRMAWLGSSGSGSQEVEVILSQGLKYPFPKWLTFMVGKLSCLAFGGAEEMGWLSFTPFGPLPTCLVFSCHDAWLLPQKPIQKRVRQKTQCLLWSSVVSHTSSLTLDSINCTGQPWFSEEEKYARAWLAWDEDHSGSSWPLAP
jgi:hypothetical protein